MTTKEVANKLVQYCREGKNVDAINELYADNIVSKEMEGAPRNVTKGKADVLAKTVEWYSSVEEIHSGEISDPLVAGSHFTVTMDMDVTYKKSGRMPMSEIAVFEVKDGKIVAEQFYYNMG
ncbi:nuclear transport factor 2 family protein [Mucilaginibacter sp.]|uniref:nuclear transport factor 2 family protein n=1 Tax=Mucilaginibacter sp. TaxID=1882438 RepID=UPI002627C745|nr:nuclear transport factor 2 family protein [Mucilaginibacter sp.]MDB4926043.1 nuclear transport factor 2 family protein [Mucilaginibacter sp.]